MFDRVKSDAGVGVATFLIAVGCVLVGGGAAAGAVVSVINNYGPQDNHAVQTGPKTVVPPDEVLSYGG
jgi:hypothetical protein